MKWRDLPLRKRAALEERAATFAAQLGWSRGGYADGPHGESRDGWLDPFGNVWTAGEIIRGFDPDRRAQFRGAFR